MNISVNFEKLDIQYLNYFQLLVSLFILQIHMESYKKSIAFKIFINIG